MWFSPGHSWVIVVRLSSSGARRLISSSAKSRRMSGPTAPTREGLLVLEGRAGLDGYVLVSRAVDGFGWILSIGVARARRGRGLGRRLMTEALHRLGTDGAVEARLAVHPANEAALGLYKSLGFVAEGDVRRDYYGPGEDRLLLRLDLAGPGSGWAPGSTRTRAAGTLSRSEGRRP
ncbi:MULTISPECIES: GNAT family N-acetyltransferase [unclassified Streptomyces]|uniref:GNAT family N-acetyltransferase n=1 Tax=unclassified Streptomyces TaxID=2593676 RepID=UPI0033A24597